LKIHVVWMIQGVAGMAILLAWNVWAALEPYLLYRLWFVLNLVFASALSVYLGLNVCRAQTYKCWLVFGSSLLGLVGYLLGGLAAG